MDSTEQKRLLMDLDVSMRVTDCPYTVHFYGALFREVIVLIKGDVILWQFRAVAKERTQKQDLILRFAPQF